MHSLSWALLSIFSIHFLVAYYIYDIYSLDRVFVTLFLSLFVLKEVFSSKENLYVSWHFYGLLFLLFYGALQTLTSPYITTEFEVLQQLYIACFYILFIFALLLLQRVNYKLREYLLMVTTLSAMSILFMLIMFLLKSSNIYDIVIVNFGNIRIFNHLQTIIIPSLGLGLFLARDEKYRTLFTLLLILNFMLLLLTGARGSFYAILLAYTFLFVSSFSSKKIRRHILLMGSIFFLSVGLYMFLHYTYAEVGNFAHITTTVSAERLRIYKFLLHYVIDTDYFWSAIGFSSQDVALYNLLHPHNLFFYIFLGMGGFGLLLFTVLSFLFFKDILLKYLHTKQLYKRYLLIIFLALFIHSLVSGVYITPLTSLLFLFFIVVFLEAYKDEKRVGTLKSWTLRLPLVVLVVATTVLTYENYVLKKRYEKREVLKNVRHFSPGIMLYNNYFIQIHK